MGEFRSTLFTLKNMESPATKSMQVLPVPQTSSSLVVMTKQSLCCPFLFKADLKIAFISSWSFRIQWSNNEDKLTMEQA